MIGIDASSPRRVATFVTGLLPILLLAACATKAPPPVPTAAAHPRSVAIVPVLRSEDLTIVRRSPVGFLGGIPLLIERADRVQKQRVFEKEYESDRVAVAQALTASLLAAAQRRGYEAVVLDGIRRNPEDPDDIDYTRVDTAADVIIHVRVSDIGLLNPMTSTDYEPYVDVKARVVARESGFEVLDESFSFGANGSKGDPTSVPSDPADRWPDFETVLVSHERLSASWTKGARALGQLIVAKLPAPSR